MAKYQVRYASTFFKAMDKLDRGTQKVIAKWIDKHLVNVDFPKAPGKYLTGNLSGYVRFRVGSYRIIAQVDDEKFIIMNVHVAKRSEVYRFKGKN
ncbi:plasmid addiction system poison protein [Streptococcus criceti]|uniref:Toxin-antitoxin system, toxin component, RelE family n=1 Tax=Streptococcus criceti HS-6 TaxID=873449 RepID=G5JSF9_STRCG|nr:type II toxin-antitoxin system RelE/ParE family toxin [Streptococcus criceti]EHI73800.1 toxin-antitoxin system, toxin component, RelE family [Streptococcus criceti HS-6]SUN42772.1 plasmid addiction system poison protein [Streptococcus criceti]